MLPENEFHAAPIPGAPKPNGSKWYSTQEVLGLTKMSRFTLIRKTKDDNFPKPIKVAHGKNMYAKTEVHEWIKEHKEFLKSYNPNRQVTINFTPKEYAKIKRGAQALECNMETFIKEAAVHKSKLVLKACDNNHVDNSFIF